MENGHCKTYPDKAKIVYVLILILFCAALFTPSAFKRDLHYRDELRYAEVAREMRLNQTWLVPHFGGAYYSEKPPVYFWLLNLCRTVFGDYSTFAMVFPSILAGIIAVLLTFFFGSRMFSSRYAFLAGLVLATSPLFFGLAIFLRMDMLLTVFTTAASIMFYQGCRQEDPGLKNKFYYWFYVLMSLAVLVKGPTGFLMPFVTAAAFLALAGKWAEFKKLKLIQGLGILIGVIALWAAALILSGNTQYAYRLFIVQTFGRAVNSFAHKQPFYYYLELFPAGFFPWIFFLISVFVFLIKNRSRLTADDKFLLSWFIAPFLLMSFFSGKLFIYLLPIFPAAALLVARLFEAVFEQKARASYFTVPALATLAVLLLLIFVLPRQVQGIPVRSLFGAATIPYTLLALIALYFLARKRYDKTPQLIAGMVFVFFSVFSFNVIPRVSSGYTLKPTAYRLKKLHDQGAKDIVAYQYLQPESLAVYNGFMVKNVGDKRRLQEYLGRHPRAVILTTEEQWESLKSLPRHELEKFFSSNGSILVRQKRQQF